MSTFQSKHLADLVKSARLAIAAEEPRPSFTCKVPPGEPESAHVAVRSFMERFAAETLQPFQGKGWQSHSDFNRDAGVYTVSFERLYTPAVARIDAALEELRGTVSPADLEKTRQTMLANISSAASSRG
jgi:hypothetical protein